MSKRKPKQAETERDALTRCRTQYMMVGDLDKTFHRCECECRACEEWRASKGRPTRAELRAMDAKKEAPS